MPSAPSARHLLIPAGLAALLFLASLPARAGEPEGPRPEAAAPEVLNAGTDGPALDSLRRTADRREDEDGHQVARMLLFFGLGWVAAVALRRRR